MSTGRIRGGAGVAFGLLGIILLLGGPGFAVSAAAPGCKDNPTCYVEAEEQGTVGPQGQFIASYTASCRGDCTNGVEGVCEERSQDNPDGTRTFHCACDFVDSPSPSDCSGFPMVNGEGQVQDFICSGDCGVAHCRPMVYNVVTDKNCPTGYSLNRRCICE